MMEVKTDPCTRHHSEIAARASTATANAALQRSIKAPMGSVDTVTEDAATMDLTFTHNMDMAIIIATTEVIMTYETRLVITDSRIPELEAVTIIVDMTKSSMR
jgi:hypothetical protein